MAMTTLLNATPAPPHRVFPPARLAVMGVLVWMTVFGLSSPSIFAQDPSTPKPQFSTANYRDDVRPFFRRYCAECHNPEKRRGGINLEELSDGESFQKNYKAWETIVEVLETRSMPPEKKPAPKAEEYEKVAGWIESELGKLDCSGPIDPGRVTMRRLNRVEYNNSVRDLIGVDLKPAEEFPADDVGYGFDNIGDVLTLPPMLLEKYLEAAAKVAETVIVDPKAQAPRVSFEDERLASSFGGKSEDDGYTLASTGTVTAKPTINKPGRYRISVRACADQAGSEPAKMAVQLDGKTLKTLDVPARRGAAKEYSVETTLKPGRALIAAAFVNDFYNPNDPNPNNRDRNLCVQAISIEGPLRDAQGSLPKSHSSLFAAAAKLGEKASETDRARAIFRELARRAYRRPVTDEEVNRLVGLVELARKQGDSFERGVQLGLQAVLVSPHFLFRVEAVRPDDRPGLSNTIGPFELASRLSYFLWSSMPDEELLSLAASGTLGQPKVLETQVIRMLHDPKAQALVRNFGEQWLQIRNLKSFAPDRKQFPTFNESLRAAMFRETELFLASIIREDRSIFDLIEADYTFVNEPLAKHYGIAGVSGDEFRKVSVNPDQRGGVLFLASVLAVTSNPTRTSPVKRGKWVLEQLLGEPPPPPPANVPPLSEDGKQMEAASLRQRMEQHRKDPACANCHAKLDPMGFGMENYDAIGAWRTRDGKFPVDASGSLPDGTSFEGPKGVKQLLHDRREAFARCLAEKLMTYALGRGLEYPDKCSIENVLSGLAEGQDKFSRLVLEIVTSEPFQKRRILAGRPQ